MIPPFSFLPDIEIKKIVRNLSLIHHPKGQSLLIQERSVVESLSIIHKGAVERYYENNGKKTLVDLLEEGDLYGGISLLANEGVSIRSLRTTEDSDLYRLPETVFLDICKRYDVFTDYFTDIFGKRILDKSYASITNRTINTKDDAWQFFNQSIETIYSSNPIFCHPDTSIKSASDLMSSNKSGYILVKDEKGNFNGIVTDHFLRLKVISQGYNAEKDVTGIMSSPLNTISHQALVFEVLMAMIHNNLKYLAVTDSSKKVVGIISSRDLIKAQWKSPFFIIREIVEAGSKEEIMDNHTRLPGIIKSLIQSGAKAKNINTIITAVSDTLLKKFIYFAIQELGEPPVKFAFVVLGSEGRKEQTLKTDQDNAIVFEDPPEGKRKMVEAYFMAFSKKICTWLDRAGYNFCDGDIMAQNTKWCQSLSTWKHYFSQWTRKASPEDLLQANIFFDFRVAYGDPDIINELHDYLLSSVRAWSGFLRNLTENALNFRPPLGFFRNFVVESKGTHRNKFDIKRSMMPIVDFARIYALANNIKETNTLERLYQLKQKNILGKKDYSDLEQSYSFLMQLRLARQLTAIMEEEEEPDNYINPKILSIIEQKTLKEIFKRVLGVQSKLNFEFTGNI